MNPAQFLAYFDRVSEAPDAVLSLRRFILDLAVRGKLVEQDPNDEPASELLKRIQEQKARQIKTGAIRKLPPLGEGEVPFTLPDSWEWVRVGEGFLYDAGVKRKPSELELDLPLLELEDIERDTGAILARLKVSDRNSLSTKSEFREGDILYGKLRPYLNKVVVATERGYSTTEIVAIRPFVPLCTAYCCLAFRRPDFVAYVNRLGQGTKMPRLRTPDAILAVFPLPPIAEQHRIAARVDELMALCGQLEEAQAERESRRDRLAMACLQRLSQPKADDRPSFREHSRFYFQNITCLTIRPEQIQQVRRAIRELAIRGRLVPQDSNDKPSASLGGRPHSLAEKFPLPAGWAWLKGHQVADFVDPQPSHRTPPEHAGGIPYVGYADIDGDNQINFKDARKVAPDVLSEHRQRYTLSRGDFVIGKIGTIGQPHFLPAPFNYALSANLILVQPKSDIALPSYLVVFFRSPMSESTLRVQKTDSTHAVFGIKKAREFMIPVPPLPEQRRIVAKVDELMALCDRLEEQLTTTQAEGRRLLEAVLNEALAAV